MKRPNLFTRSKPDASPEASPDPLPGGRPRPERVCYVIGDIHGCADCLEDILTLIDQDIGAHKVSEPALAFVGNYIGHGPSSLIVLDRMQELCELFPKNVVCLMGSQERLLLDMFTDPDRRAGRWLSSGGDTILAEVLATDRSGMDPPNLEDMRGLASYLRGQLGESALNWLSDLPLSWSSGNLWVVHAGADPFRPMAEQSPRILLWGHPEFHSAQRSDDVWIAHGHSAVGRAGLVDRRITVDTEAHRTGVLSAVAVTPDGPMRVLSTQSSA